MATTRTFPATTDGPILVIASGSVIDIDVIAEPGRTRGEITLSTNDDEGPSAEMVNAAEFIESGDKLTVRIPKGAGATTIMNTGRGGISVASIDGDVIMTGGASGSIVVNGVRISGGGGGVQVNSFGGGGGVFIGGFSRVALTARVPEKSSVRADTQSGAIATTGIMRAVSGKSQSGNVHVDYATDVHAETMSGGVSVDRLAGNASLRSMSGNVTVHAVANSRASASTMSGNVSTSKDPGVEFDVDGSSMSGRVRSR